jgi:hypothetical protein
VEDTLYPMVELAPRWGVTSNTVSRRLAYLGIKPIRQGNFRYLTAEQLDLAEQLQQHVLSGKPMEAFPKPDGETTAIARRSSSKKDEPDAMALVAAMAAQLAPAPDPLSAARRIKEAADLGVWLSNAEAAAMLGVSASTMRSYEHGHCPRPGFSLERRSEGGVWWRVCSSDAPAPSLSPAKDGKRVGFDVAASITLQPTSAGSRIFAMSSLC